jgi:primosomal protein N' (replication factor Y)
MIARVLLAAPAKPLDRLFDYQVPEEMAREIQIGARVVVPFGFQRLHPGYVWELADHSEYQELKSVTELIDREPLINPVHIQLIDWMADYYYCSRSEVIKCCLPPGSGYQRKRYYRAVGDWHDLESRIAIRFPAVDPSQAILLIKQGLKAKWTQEAWKKNLGDFTAILDYLLKNQLLIADDRLAKPKVEPKWRKIYRLADSAEFNRETEAGLRVWEVLCSNQSGMARDEICAAADVSPAVITRLLKEGKLIGHDQKVERIPAGFQNASASRVVSLTPEQRDAYDRIIDPSGPQLFLLHGITGSGKTEVYFEAASAMIQNGYQVLYLVPEIALTPQTLERARSRFGDEVALLHSNMSDGERYDQWFNIRAGKASFIIGARSAVFAPFNRLGLIIVDEEHESTYKQEDSPRYHIRRVTEFLADRTGAKVVFGSATPSLESFFYAQTGRYAYLQLKDRFNRKPLPQITTVDMREELKSGNRNILSRVLVDAVTEALANREQIVLLLNRRGYATFILCRECGQVIKCPACDVSLTFHANDNLLRCHYCDYRQPAPSICPSCGSNRIRYFGHGTQKLEEELKTCFPNARTIRMDVDTTSRKGAHQGIYEALNNGSVDLLLGTQMVAKGLDLPRVTVVGVISADSTLNLPDFRAAERTFQLLTQVAGRAGRGQKPGKVIFQAYNLEHYSLQYARFHNYTDFYATEIVQRQEYKFPPFYELLKFGFSGLAPERVREAATAFSEILKRNIVDGKAAGFPGPNDDHEILGPSPSLIARIQNQHRWQVLLKSSDLSGSRPAVGRAWEEYQGLKITDVRVTRDRNPYTII